MMKSCTATITRLAPALMLALLPMTAAAQGQQPPVAGQQQTPDVQQPPPVAAQQTPDLQQQAPDMERQTSGVTVPVDAKIGTEPGAEPSVPTTSTFRLQRFAQQDGGLVALGTLAVTFTDTATKAARTIVSQQAIPVDQRQLTASCPAIHLVLGPLDPTLLQLPVHVNEGVLDVAAAPREGNQPRNPICSGTEAGTSGNVAPTAPNTGTSAGAPIDQTVDQLNQLLAGLDQSSDR